MDAISKLLIKEFMVLRRQSSSKIGGCMKNRSNTELKIDAVSREWYILYIYGFCSHG